MGTRVWTRIPWTASADVFSIFCKCFPIDCAGKLSVSYRFRGVTGDSDKQARRRLRDPSVLLGHRSFFPVPLHRAPQNGCSWLSCQPCWLGANQIPNLSDLEKTTKRNTVSGKILGGLLKWKVGHYWGLLIFLSLHGVHHWPQQPHELLGPSCGLPAPRNTWLHLDCTTPAPAAHSAFICSMASVTGCKLLSFLPRPHHTCLPMTRRAPCPPSQVRTQTRNFFFFKKVSMFRLRNF